MKKYALLSVVLLVFFLFLGKSIFKAEPIPEVPPKEELAVAEPLIEEDQIGELIEELEVEEHPQLTTKLASLVDNGVSFDISPQTLDPVYDLYEEDLPSNVEEEEHRPNFGPRPVIAIVIDDMGISLKRTADINSLHAPLTSSFLTYAKNLNRQIKASKAAGHDVIVHIPMEAQSKKDVAPDVLTVGMSKEEIEKNLEKMLEPFKGIRGVNNHMGSKFTSNAESMSYVMVFLKKNHLFFLDSKTSAQSKGKITAQKYGVEYASRNVFLDNENDYEYIMGQLKQTEKIAEKNGYAVAIGHPKSQTYLALKDWIPTLKEKNINLVPLSQIIETLNQN